MFLISPVRRSLAAPLNEDEGKPVALIETDPIVFIESGRAGLRGGFPSESAESVVVDADRGRVAADEPRDAVGNGTGCRRRPSRVRAGQ